MVHAAGGPRGTPLQAMQTIASSVKQGSSVIRNLIAQQFAPHPSKPFTATQTPPSDTSKAKRVAYGELRLSTLLCRVSKTKNAANSVLKNARIPTPKAHAYTIEASKGRIVKF